MNLKRQAAGAVKAGDKIGGQFATLERTPTLAPAVGALTGFDPELLAELNVLTPEQLDEMREEQQAEFLAPEIAERKADRLVQNPPPAVTRPVWANAQKLRSRRGQDFYPSAAKIAAIPAIYSNEEGGPQGAGGLIAYEHYFGPTGDFYVSELDQRTGEAFGVFVGPRGQGDAEMTYFDLPYNESLSAVTGQGIPVYWERDEHFSLKRVATARPEIYGGRAVDRLTSAQGQTLKADYEAWRSHCLQVNSPDFQSTDFGQVAARATELRAVWTQRAEEYGIVLHDGGMKPFHDLASTNRGDWEDDILQAKKLELSGEA